MTSPDPDTSLTHNHIIRGPLIHIWAFLPAFGGTLPYPGLLKSKTSFSQEKPSILIGRFEDTAVKSGTGIGARKIPDFRAAAGMSRHPPTPYLFSRFDVISAPGLPPCTDTSRHLGTLASEYAHAVHSLRVSTRTRMGFLTRTARDGDRKSVCVPSFPELRLRSNFLFFFFCFLSDSETQTLMISCTVHRLAAPE